MQTSDASNFFRAEADMAKADARAAKADRTKLLGDPIEVKGKVLRIRVLGQDAWTAESGSVIRRVSLQTGKTIQLYKGHTGPVTSIEFYQQEESTYLISGSWDKHIRVWDTKTKETISDTAAHSDFVKSLLVIPSLQILVSGSSDKTIRLWDLSSIGSNPNAPLQQLGSLTGHTRPIEALAYDEPNKRLYTADSMGLIKVWTLEYDKADLRCRGTLVTTLNGHRTGVNEIHVQNGHVWSASTDETIKLQNSSSNQTSTTIPHPSPVKCLLPLHLFDPDLPYLITGTSDLIHTYDISNIITTVFETGSRNQSSSEPPTLVSVTDAHWHDVSGVGWWMKEVKNEEGVQVGVEPWIVSGSLDGTIRKWKLSELVSPATSKSGGIVAPEVKKVSSSGLTEEEERELAELEDL